MGPAATQADVLAAAVSARLLHEESEAQVANEANVRVGNANVCQACNAGLEVAGPDLV